MKLTFLTEVLLRGCLIATAALAVHAVGSHLIAVLYPPRATDPTTLVAYHEWRARQRIQSPATGTLTLTGCTRPDGSGCTDFDTINLGPATPVDVGAITFDVPGNLGAADTVFRVRDGGAVSLMSVSGTGELRVGDRMIKLTPKEQRMLREGLR